MIQASSPANKAFFTSGKIISIDLSNTKSAPSYDIVIGDNIISEAGSLISVRLGKRRCIIITDTNVAPLYLPRLEAVLGASGHQLLPSLTVTAGESSKNFDTLQLVLNHMLTSGVDRKTLVIAFGGGVVGDLAGVAASLVLRGVDIVQIPTTLLAQVDSSVGGKTGIDTIHGKNTVGSFYQPRLVIADVALLDSLPQRELRAGYAEIVKYGLIKDRAFFGWCQTHGQQLLNGDRSGQIYAVGVSCDHKAKIVAADERESGERALLNLGHTFGHALEASLHYNNSLLHGEAVAIGLVMAFRLSAQMGLCPESDVEKVRDHLRATGLPIVPPPGPLTVDQLMDFMAHDKKSEGGQLTLNLTHGIGQSFIINNVNNDSVLSLLKEFLALRSAT